ncbi:hypothetical protein PUNSTDRAFT_128204 [Punctularia strigosozonata HHB-11173 SS5]|uniref:Uncharacterized protein n=1 Tax=Punctularia strigosozonata (strain HHB-11173) TaxID=741275 RepID=R7S332_PUNST|nr:uncharacterized protein PUNSTDRAFT_128204 [Punctularia strigosozonata HHB-11173 SS5]EIN04638.1 hypothetical protein PUNSTDRAFT_128204 [Punctularia strigosozonata HHB-11173 SS5]
MNTRPTAHLLALPEELLEHILAICIPPAPSPPLPSFLSSHATAKPSPALALLLAHRTLRRIVTPLLYRRIVITSQQQAVLLARSLRARPALGTFVRELAITGAYAAFADIVGSLTSLDVLDVTLDADDEHPQHASYPTPTRDHAVQRRASLSDVSSAHALEFFVAALERVGQGQGGAAPAHLVLRRARGTSTLACARVQEVLGALATALNSKSWGSTLETLTIAFPLCIPFSAADQDEDTKMVDADKLRALLNALARASALRTVRTALPTVWNPALSLVAANPALQRVVFLPPHTLAAFPPVPPDQIGTATTAPSTPQRSRSISDPRAIYLGASSVSPPLPPQAQTPLAFTRRTKGDGAGSRFSSANAMSYHQRLLNASFGIGVEMYMREAARDARLAACIYAGTPSLKPTPQAGPLA